MNDTGRPDWLRNIKLVTFDCFGTLIDWRTGMEQVGIKTEDDFADFEKRCLKIQESDRHTPYVRMLKDVLAAMRPDLRRAIVGLFADDFGRMASFRDSPQALSSLKQMVKVGVLSNCDANHQLDVMSTLRVAWDVCITSQDIRAYKPTDRAWDTIVRMGVARTAVAPEQWLHVSAYGRYDLEPAHARRLRTCHVRRPGGDDKANADMAVENLDELVEILAVAKEGPLTLQIRSTTDDESVREKLRVFLAPKQLARVREVPGVTGAQLLEDGGSLIEQYTFGGKGEHEAYVEAFAAEHQGDVRAEFGEQVKREESVLMVRGSA
jgi:2-haloacid dehalogenase